MSMNTTAPQEREVKHIPPLDAAAIEKAAAAWVSARLQENADTTERARAAAKIATAEAKAADKARADRDAAAYTVVTEYRIRRGADMPAALGVNRNRWKVIRDRQKELADAGAWAPVPDALAVLPKLSAKTAQHAARAEAARVARDEATKELLEQGKSNAEIARLIGRDPSRVSHIKYREGSAA